MSLTSRVLAVILGVSVWAVDCGSVHAAGNVIMPFRYRNAQNGATIQGNTTFANVYYDNAGAYCVANHRDPGGNKYGHGHLPAHFPFNVQNGPNVDNVTAGKSDWAWDAHYVSYTMASGSTFELNCFAHSTDAPTVMFHDGWTAFTDASTQCEATNKTKSYGDADHVIKITGTFIKVPEQPCLISSTSEKNASGGVYTHGWGPVGINADKPVRKRK